MNHRLCPLAVASLLCLALAGALPAAVRGAGESVVEQIDRILAAQEC